MHTFTIDQLDHPLRVVRFTGHESLSRPFRFEITLAGEQHDLALGHLVGRSAVLAIDAEAELPEPRPIHGIVGRVARTDAGRTGGAYLITVVPAMSRLCLRTDSRIFQGLTVPEILADVFERGGFGSVDPRRRGAPSSSYRMALAGTYRARENCVQYRESDWDFVNRLMEEEGFHYFFEHDASSHVLVISDSPTEHASIVARPKGGDAIPYRLGSGALRTGEHVSRFECAEEARPERLVVSDYNFERPMLPLTAAAPADARAVHGGASHFEVFEHPGDYDLPEAGRRVAQVRLEELLASRWTGEGDSDSPRLSPGRTFLLTDHPSAELNRRYLITRVEHRWAEGDPALHQYGCRFEVMPSDVAFRPPRRTPRPLLRGIQTAIVVGPPGEEIHTDEHGRVKVRFHWDRSGRDDDRCSCWIRVAQASAGTGWGSLFLPRVGHEVVVDFLDGDPDRPLVTGSVYHGANVPPYALPAEKTKSTVKTHSSPGGSGSNELRFEDRKGAEEVYLHAQKDLAVKVEHDETEHVGRNREAHVTGLDTETVLLAQTVMVGGAQTVTVGAAQAITVAGVKTEMVGLASIEGVGLKKSTTVGLSYSAKAGTNISTTSGRNTSIQAVGNVSEHAGKNLTMQAGHDLSATAAVGSITLQAGKGMHVDVTGSHEEQVSGKRTLIVGEELSIKCGGSVITIDKSGKITVEGADITVKSKGAIKVEGQKLQVKSEKGVTVDAKGPVTVTGPKVSINP
jgi:type VI secretion system secreted protein VgrG